MNCIQIDTLVQNNKGYSYTRCRYVISKLSALQTFCGVYASVTGRLLSQSAIHVELWCLLCFQPEQTVEQTAEKTCRWFETPWWLCNVTVTKLTIFWFLLPFVNGIWFSRRGEWVTEQTTQRSVMWLNITSHFLSCYFIDNHLWLH